MKKRTIINILIAISCLITLGGCNQKQSKESALDKELAVLELPSSTEDAYRKSASLIDALTMTMKSFELTGSDDDYLEIVKTYNDLIFNYDNDVLTEEGRKACAAQKYKTDSIRSIALQLLTDNLPYYRHPLVNEDDKLIEGAVTYPVYLPKGSRLYIDFGSSSVNTLRLINADSRATLRTWASKTTVHDSIAIANSAIYLIEVKPKGNAYIKLLADRSCKDLDDVLSNYEITEEEVNCRQGDFLARKVEGIGIDNLFEEPRKVTLRSQGKAFFSGGSRSVVAMQVPANSTDIAYSLRISTSQTDQSSDGQFCKKVNEKYKEIKFLGLPIYESHGTSSNLFRELLNATEPPREEEAYCNLYVFTSQSEAKKFSDGKPVSELKYNMDFSKQGTQSCNDRIPSKGIKTLYFGFENTRVRYSVYLWLESVSTVKKTEYFKTKYTLEE